MGKLASGLVGKLVGNVDRRRTPWLLWENVGNFVGEAVAAVVKKLVRPGLDHCVAFVKILVALLVAGNASGSWVRRKYKRESTPFGRSASCD